MLAFRVLLVALFLAICTYTAIVIANHGPNLIEVFFGDIAALTWPGQFNFDFSCYLLLSALWVAWRHQFSGSGIALALIASVAGILFLSVYLLVASVQTGGDMKALLLGKARAAR